MPLSSLLAVVFMVGVIAVKHTAAAGLNDFPGHAFAWGLNTSGQLGNGTTASSEIPVAVSGVQASSISAGQAHTLAIFSLSESDSLPIFVRAWGDNSFGQLGDGTTTSSSTPVDVRFPPEVPSWVRIRTVTAGARHSLALAYQTGQSSSMVVFAWGDNSSGQLGIDGISGSLVPLGVELPDEFLQLQPDYQTTAIAAGEAHSLALSPLGNVYAWGDNSFGQLGDGTTVSRSTPQRVVLPPEVRVKAVAAGGGFSLALTTAGTIYAWGDNSLGQLGTSNAGGFSVIPTLVALPPLAPGQAVVAITAGSGHSLALVWDSANPELLKTSLLAWGDNSYGQLGDGTNIQQAAPVSVAIPLGTLVTAMAAGATHSLAVNARDSTFFAWGDNASGQLGDGTLMPHLIPESVSPPYDSGFIVDVAAGNGFSVATVTPRATEFSLFGVAPQISVLSGNALPDTSSPSNPSFYGQSIYFAVVVQGFPAPTGTVSFLVDGNPFGEALLLTITIPNASIARTPPITALSPGAHTVTVNYSGDSVYLPGSQTFTQTVVKAGTAANLSSSFNPSDPAQPVVFTVALSGGAPPLSPPPDCSATLPAPDPTGDGLPPPPPPCTPPTGETGTGCSATDPTCPPPPPSEGMGLLGTGCSASDPTCATTPVSALTTLSTDCPAADPTCVSPPPECTDSTCTPPTAWPTGPPAPQSGTVTFTVDGNPLVPPIPLTDGRASTPPLTGLAPGPHSIWISYAGDANYLSFPLVGEFGLPLAQFVRFPTSVTLTSSSPLVYGQPATLTATLPQSWTACPICNTVYPTGTITFEEAADVLAVQNLTGSQATVTLPALSVGVHPIMTTYSGDETFAESAALDSIVVNRAATTLAISSSLNPSVLNQPVTFTARLTVDPPGAGMPTGTVTFSDGATTLASMPLDASGQMTFSTAALTVNEHSIAAAYSGDGNFLDSTGSLTQKVQYEPAGTLCHGDVGHQILLPIRAGGGSVFKQGSTVPAKFRVCDVNDVSVGVPGVVASFFLAGIITGTRDTPVEDVVGSTNPDAAFRWDAANQQWIFNISTSNLTAGSTYVFVIGLNDGTTISFQFGLK